MPRQLYHRILSQDRAGHHDRAALLGHRQLRGALALLERHGVELALLAVDKEARDAELAGPVAQVAAPARLVEAEIGLERRKGGGPDAAQMLARIGLGVLAAIMHAASLNDAHLRPVRE